MGWPDPFKTKPATSQFEPGPLVHFDRSNVSYAIGPCKLMNVKNGRQMEFLKKIRGPLESGWKESVSRERGWSEN